MLIEPYHAVTYFNPESDDAYAEIGLRGFWRGYFAGRAAPLGPVGPGVVTASFFGFEPGFVARALPSIWSIVTPKAAIEARMRGADRALRRLLGTEISSPALAEAAALARRATDGARSHGRPLFAANAELDWPSDPHLVLWHAATLIREHRGDGHVAALSVAGLHPCEAHVSQVAASGAGLETIQPYRGWADADWAMGVEQLRSRGWLDDDDGHLTPQGRAGRDEIEATTNRLAMGPLERLGTEGTAHLLALLAPIADRLVRTDAIRYPNPIGVPLPS
jgi:hypothetical protein